MMILAARRRTGFTVVEFFVVMAIIAVLVALLLPSVSRSREAARRTQCKNNLKQMGLALMNYHDTYQSFPAGFTLSSDGPYTGWGWGIQLVPYLDGRSYSNNVKFQNGLQHEYNQPHMNPTMPVYVCPSDPGERRVPHLGVVTTDVRGGEVTPASVDAVGVFSRSTYFAVAGYLPASLGGIERTASESKLNSGRLGEGGLSALQARYCDQRRFRGVFGQNSNVKLADLKDGTSNVMAVGERYSISNVSLGSVGHGTWLGVPDCTTSVGLSAALGDTSVKLNLGSKPRAETTGFGSFHLSGAQFLFADGSVRFLNDNIELSTYRDLSTIDDGRQVGSF